MQITAVSRKQKTALYASPEDFCRIFREDMTGLYLLAFLLTVDGREAEQCFVSGLEDSSKGNKVFIEWARSWARHTIIKNAVRLIKPRPAEELAGANAISMGREAQVVWRKRTELIAVLKLPEFERFVFVMCALHGYSDQDCSVLLGCTRRDVVAARTRLGHMPEFAETPAQRDRQTASGDELLIDEMGYIGRAQAAR